MARKPLCRGYLEGISGLMNSENRLVEVSNGKAESRVAHGVSDFLEPDG